MKKLIGIFSLLALTLGVVQVAHAADTVNYTATGSNSTDSGTCGPDWASDTMTRQYRVYPEVNVDGSYRIQENFLKGKFTTISGPSPESCEAGTTNTIIAGVKGDFHGAFIIKVTPTGTFTPLVAGTCTAPCDTATFVEQSFGVGSTYTVSDYWLKYTTKQPLACAKKWINAATGDSGDIATTC